MNEGKNLLFTFYGLQDEQIKGAVTVVAYHFKVHLIQNSLSRILPVLAVKVLRKEIRARETST
jgi:hypothetical protein